MKVLHLSAECYPVAKVGGLADVAGSLPKFQTKAGVNAMMVMPYYERPFVADNYFETVYEARVTVGATTLPFTVMKEVSDQLGFELYLVHIPGVLDRKDIYGYEDETEQFVAFQIASLDWILSMEQKPDIIHCHDYHTGLVPFLMTCSYRYKSIEAIPTVFTIHNGQYQGWFGWEKYSYLPDVDSWKWGLLDWGGTINPMASAVKCCWKFTTVSPGYLEELKTSSKGLESLFQMEEAKGMGIVNGIDTEVWNPATDPMLPLNYNADNVSKGKQENKRFLCKQFGFSLKKPLFAFIGRLVEDKGADLLAGSISRVLTELDGKASFLILGSGDRAIEQELEGLKDFFKKNYNVCIGYDEELSHRIYAGADFLLMPSRVEPCGLNQLYALRYGTVPIVRSTGGLKDTIKDINEPEGYGIRFEQPLMSDVFGTVERALELSQSAADMRQVRRRMMALDYSWDQAAAQYMDVYRQLKTN